MKLIRYSRLLLYAGSSKMCHISFVLYVGMQEGLGRWENMVEMTSEGHSCGFFCSIVASTW